MLYTLAKPSRLSLLLVTLWLLLLVSCTTIRNYPSGKPFVYETNINLAGKFSKEEQKVLESSLRQQLHDSLQVRSISKLIGWKNGPRLFYKEIVNPPVYDSLNASKSTAFMHALLNAQGYFRDTITFDTTLKQQKDQLRTTVNFNVVPGKLVTIDSVSFNLENDTLRYVTEQNMGKTLLKKGVPFSKNLISQEFDRLVSVYRNNGYLQFSFEDLIAVFDTVGIDLLRPTFDPIEQARQLQELQRRRENPSATVEVRLRAKEDTTRLVRYKVGDITIYPDLSADTANYIPRVDTINGVQVITYRDLFKPRIVAENIMVRKGDLYSHEQYLRTLLRLNGIGSWRLVSIDPLPRKGSDTVDFSVKMFPAARYKGTINIEGSQNRGNPYVGAIGFGINASLNNRNFARAANQAVSSVRYGIELGTKGQIQTQIVSLNNSIIFPRLIPRITWVPFTWRENARTALNFNINNTDRFRWFNLSSLNLNWGYSFTRDNKLLTFTFPNIEYSFITRREELEKRIAENSSYRYIFNDGLVSSAIVGYTVTGGYRRISNQKRINLEASGLTTGFIRSPFLDSNLYRFLRLDAEFRQVHQIGKSAFAWRLFGGAGIGMPRFKTDQANRYLPFFKQYFGGGPNSMRAWGLRKLGPGSNDKSIADTIAPERFGDMQLEANAEYRFPLFNMSGVQINSAFFTDIGNIWFLRKNEDFLNGEFRPERFFTDLAIGTGTGLRVDFGFFLVRLDYAYKVKDPAKRGRDQWFNNWQIRNGMLQLGINYPF
jgi:outer membrane protein assembly factor BamA